MCMVAIVAALAVTANAGILYQTGFEASEGFVVGSIDGQDGWVETNGATTILATTNSPFGSVNVLKIQKTGSSTPYARKYFETDANVDRVLVDVEVYAQVGASTMKGYFTLGHEWRTGARWGFAGSGEGTGSNFYVQDGADVVYGTAHYSIWTTYKFVVSADAINTAWSLDVYDGSDNLLDSFTDLGFQHEEYFATGGYRFDSFTVTRPTGATMIADDLVITEVPEPATMGILLLGGLSLLRKRRKA
ncbi:MAG: PEP-CTERM sorting domain-containing protein [Anaerohalosphaeraceae bacterium]|nr:PEP-CTERM sorting domain-containing protein [Anaerohalosphaeraceae bacterium]